MRNTISIGGLGSTVCDVVATPDSVKVIKIELKDTFCKSGSPRKLLIKYGLTTDNIYEQTTKILINT